MQTWWLNLYALRNITAEWLSKTCYDVAIESPLQPLTGEIIEPKIVNCQDEASMPGDCDCKTNNHIFTGHHDNIDLHV